MDINREDAEPASLRTCSSTRWLLGGLLIPIEYVIIAMGIAKFQGPR